MKLRMQAFYLFSIMYVNGLCFQIWWQSKIFGVDTADFVWCRDGTRAIPVPAISQFPVAHVRLHWCGSGARQTRHHLFMVCRRWTPEIRELWQKVRLETGWGGAPSIRRLFGDERAVKAILEFLEKTKVGKMPSRILLAGGPDLEEEELDSFSLQVSGEDLETEVSLSGDEDGTDPPI